jgi:hypothetical protein
MNPDVIYWVSLVALVLGGGGVGGMIGMTLGRRQAVPVFEELPVTEAMRRAPPRPPVVPPVNGDLTRVWDETPGRRRSPRQRADTMDVIGDAYDAGREAQHAAERVPGPIDGQPPARLREQEREREPWMNHAPQGGAW